MIKVFAILSLLVGAVLLVRMPTADVAETPAVDRAAQRVKADFRRFEKAEGSSADFADMPVPIRVGDMTLFIEAYNTLHHRLGNFRWISTTLCLILATHALVLLLVRTAAKGTAGDSRRLTLKTVAWLILAIAGITLSGVLTPSIASDAYIYRGVRRAAYDYYQFEKQQGTAEGFTEMLVPVQAGDMGLFLTAYRWKGEKLADYRALCIGLGTLIAACSLFQLLRRPAARMVG